MPPRSTSSSSRISSSTPLAVAPRGACPHEIRPGTTVCLHCRQAERIAAGERRKRAAARVALTIVGVAVCGAIVANVTDGSFEMPAMPRLAGGLGTTSRSSAGPSSAAAATTTPSYGATDAAAATTTARPLAATPVIAEGRSVLRGPAVSVRAGNIVTVQFDAAETRTRRADKFESIVRVTLPEVYGAAADSALARVPAGTLTTAGELVTELPVRGVRLPLPAGGAITVWPETRPGRDGPLVVSYRTSATP